MAKNAANNNNLDLLLIGPLPPPIGGTTVSFSQLTRELEERNDVTAHVINTSRLNSKSWFGNGLLALKLLLRAASLLPSVDVVSLHASTTGTLLFAPLLATLCRIARRPFIIREFGGSFDLDYMQMPTPVRWLIAKTLRPTALLLQTRALVISCKQLIPDVKCLWYPNSRPRTQRFARSKTRTRAQRFVFAGHIKPSKGIQELLAATGRLSSLGITVDLYGPLLEGLSENAIASVPGAEYCGVLPPSEVLQKLENYDVLVLPTYHAGEGYPGAILEAYAVGLPVVSTWWRSIPEIVGDRQSGLLVPPGDIEALTEAMRKLVEEPDLWWRLHCGALARSAMFESKLWTQVFVDMCRNAPRPA